jgi:CRISPR system Cascade subunit CasC
MLIEIHTIQNHSPSNLNRDDLGAPKTCYFGGVLRSRISSQCIKRSIRMSDEFLLLRGGIRTRKLADEIAKASKAGADNRKRAAKILGCCGIKSKEKKDKDDDKSDMLVYTSREAIQEMANLLDNDEGKTDDQQLALAFGTLISEKTSVPDMALSGRMLETGILKNTTVEASLQVAHAISTHEARSEVDYYVAADDIPGDDAGAGYLDESLFVSSCFYKYFSIHWETLVQNLEGNMDLAAHTVGAFMRAAALVTPTGKQNSFAAHNPPDGILVQIQDRNIPISYANAFAKPVDVNDRDIVSQSIAQLGQYIHDLDIGFGKPQKRFWFSPNLRFPLNAMKEDKEFALSEQNIMSLEGLITSVMKEVGYDWSDVQKSIVNPEVPS